jgi:hypothetical protein
MNHPGEPGINDLLQAALFEVARPLPPPAQEPASPTLAPLDKTRRPRTSTVCEACPNSVWFASPAELRCYCRVMFPLSGMIRAMRIRRLPGIVQYKDAWGTLQVAMVHHPGKRNKLPGG